MLYNIVTEGGEVTALPHNQEREGPYKLKAGGTESFPELGLEGQTGEKRHHGYRKISTEFRELKCQHWGQDVSPPG